MGETQNYKLKEDRNKFLIIPLLVLSGVLWTYAGVGKGRTVIVSVIYICSFFYFLQYKDFRKVSTSFPLILWIVLTTYHLLNATIKHIPEIDFFDYLAGFKIYSSICIFTYLFKGDFRYTLKLLYYSTGLWLIIAISIAGFSSGTRLAGDVHDGLNAVQFGKMSALMALCGIYWSIYSKRKTFWFVVRLIFPVLFIFLCQTRTSFGIVFLVMIGFYYSIILKGNATLNNTILLGLGCVVVYVIASEILMNSGIWGRFISDVDNVNQAAFMYSTGTIFDYIAGERIIYYVVGWMIFISHPIAGIGLDHYQAYTGGYFPCHVEYMKHLAEGGIIAFVLWIWFLLYLFYTIRKSNECKQIKYMRYFIFAAILLMHMFTCSYRQELAVIWYSFILVGMDFDWEKKKRRLANILKIIKINKYASYR